MKFRLGQRRSLEPDEAPDYWITYGDLLVSLLMAFALLLFVALARVQAEVKRAEDIVKSNQNAIQIAGNALRGTGMNFALDSATGTLTLNAEVLFAYGSARLRPEAEDQIRKVATVFIPALLQQEGADSVIREIVIEGHTDTVGTYMSNLQLSQERAYSVMKAIVEDTYGAPYATQLQSLIVASGKSEVRPVRDADSIDARRSRRIELHIRSRDDAILKKVLDAARASSGAQH
jgi:chemotaxis protein MotB